jgi:hypothetical protein
LREDAVQRARRSFFSEARTVPVEHLRLKVSLIIRFHYPRIFQHFSNF